MTNRQFWTCRLQFNVAAVSGFEVGSGEQDMYVKGTQALQLALLSGHI